MSSYTPEHRAEAGEDPVVGDAPPKDNVLLSNSVYEKLKKSSLYILPAFAALYFGLAQIWGLPKAEEVVGSVACLETFLGAVLGISNKQYQNSDAKFDGQISIEPGEEEDTSNVRVQLDPTALADKDEVLVKVKK